MSAPDEVKFSPPEYTPREQEMDPPPPGQSGPQQDYQPDGPKQGYPPQQVYPPQQGYPLQQGYPAQQTVPATVIIARNPGVQPNDHLIFAIIVTLFCCFIIGIVAIIKAMTARRRWDAGDIAGAEQASQDAKSWSVCGLITGIVLTVGYVILVVVLSNSSYSYSYSYGK